MIPLLVSLTKIGYIIILIGGAIISRKRSFNGGFYFFLLLLIIQVYSFISSIFVGQLIDKIVHNGLVPWGMSVGEFVSIFSIFPLTIEIAAFLILLVSIYRKWKPERIGL